MKYSILFLLFLLLSSCSLTVDPEELYGTWNYIKVVNSDPADSLNSELKDQKPSISFSKNKDLIIEWGGERLSHGKFRMEGKMIRYTEYLDGGRKRDFPFLIKKLTENELIFATMEQDYTEVTAIRAD